MISRRAALNLGAKAGLGILVCSASSGSTVASPLRTPPSTPAMTTPPTVEPWANADFEALDAYLRHSFGRAFMIVEQGRTVHEWYRDGDSSFRRDVASAQKSVVSMLVGRAVDEGLIALDTRIAEVLGPRWTPAGESPDVDIHQLLTMTSGLDDLLAVVAPPGTTWRYSNAFARLADVLEIVTGMELDLLARSWLFDPAGASTATFRARPGSGTVAPFGLVASAVDLAAIGQLVLSGGGRAVSAAWLDTSFTPTQDLNRSYGFLWWLNGQESFVLPRRPTPQIGPLIPSAPSDLVAALGKDDQKLYISQQLNLVVARLGDRAGPATSLSLSGFDDDLWTRLIQARG